MSLTPQEVNFFNTRRNVTDRDYGRSLARNDFARAQGTWDKQLADRALKFQWDRSRDRMPGQFIRRGMSRGGVYGGALNDFLEQRTMAEGALRRQWDRETAGWSLDRGDIEAGRLNSLDMIEAEKQARQAEKAAMLASIQGSF